MADFHQLLQQGSYHAWLFIPTAILLGALHGLEPGHSKTMMAAFIIAIRGTIVQAILLGLAAAFSHTLIIWILAAVALKFGSQWNADTTEPYFQIASGIMIIGLASWMIWRTKRDVDAEAAHAHQHHDHDHDHDHEHSHSHSHGHGHEHPTGTAEFQDAHELMHATDIQKRFAGQTVTTWQVIMFGLTGGLMPCPAAFTILIICLQLKRFSLGISLVLAFSFGLALTLVTVGVLAAWSLRHAEKRFGGFGSFARKLPYLSGALLIVMGLFVGGQGLSHLKG